MEEIFDATIRRLNLELDENDQCECILSNLRAANLTSK